MTAGIAGSLLGLVVALAFVLGLAWAVLRLVKAWQDRQLAGTTPDTAALRFLRALPLGPRERVVLMEAEGERLLLGVSAGGVTLLARWPRTEAAP